MRRIDSIEAVQPGDPTGETIIFDSSNIKKEDKYKTFFEDPRTLYSNAPIDDELIRADFLDERKNKVEPLSPFAQMFFEAQTRIASLQALVDLNAQRAGQAEVSAEIAESKVFILTSQNETLEEELRLTRERLDHAFKNEQNLLRMIDTLRGTNLGGADNVGSHWSALGLDPKTAFAGLNVQQKQAVLEGAYRTRSKLFHPDNGGNEEQMRKVNAAYTALKKSIS